MRPVNIRANVLENAAGSALVRFGNTTVLCTASKIDSVPPFKKGSGEGWLTAEYAMLPASTHTRRQREGMKPDGRSVEIQRLIGRALRAAVDFSLLPECTIYIDCDVLNADGGTRTAAITGAYVALRSAVDKWLREGALSVSPIKHAVAAVSVGMREGALLVDLDYAMDSSADVDMNLVMLDNGAFIEVQGTGERAPFDARQLGQMLDAGKNAIEELFICQREALRRRGGVVVATNNAGKAREFKALLAPFFDEVYTLAEAGISLEVEEDGETFEQNALKKAQAAARLTDCAVLADDSGLCVDALDGAPGVLSARYAGEGVGDAANNALLLKNIAPLEKPVAARFVSALVLIRPGCAPLITRGECEGALLEQPRGENGFGYDPLFCCPETGLTFAEMDADAKNSISHRARALQAMVRALRLS